MDSKRVQVRRRSISLLGLAALIAVSSCRDMRKAGPARSTRTSESAAAQLVLREQGAPMSSREQAIGDVEAPPASPRPEAPRARWPVVARATAESALRDAIERSLREAPRADVGPRKDNVAPREPQPLADGRGVMPVSPRREQQTPPPPPPRAARSFATETDVALIGGGLAVAMATAAATSDGTAGNQVMAVSLLGVGVAAFATAGILSLMETTPTKQTKAASKPTAGATFTMSPGGVSGRF